MTLRVFRSADNQTVSLKQGGIWYLETRKSVLAISFVKQVGVSSCLQQTNDSAASQHFEFVLPGGGIFEVASKLTLN